MCNLMSMRITFARSRRVIGYMLCVCILAAYVVRVRDVAARRSDLVSVVSLTTEYKIDPVGIDVLKPRLSWKLKADRRGVAQTAYEIHVGLSEKTLVDGRQLV